MQAPVDIGVFVGIGPRHRIDHHLRFLRRGPIVEVDQRLAVHLAGKDREIGADACRTSYIGKGLRPEDQDHHDAKDQPGAKLR